MNRNIIIGCIVVLVGASTYFIYWKNSAPSPNSDTIIDSGLVTPTSPTYIGDLEYSSASKGLYTTYSPAEFKKEISKKRIFFFHAKWCPTCKAADEEFANMSSSIPQNVVLFKTDYDTEKQLKQKYAITYQHTFVLVDDQGYEIKKWNGGGIEELIKNTQ